MSAHTMERTCSRREFLQRAAGLTGLALLASACRAPAPAPTQAAAAAATAGPAATATKPPAKDAYLNTSSELPIAKSLITMSMVTTRQANGGKAEGMWYFEFMEKFANIKFDVTRVDVGVRAEKINLMFASNQLPDVFLHAGFGTGELVQYGMQEKQLMPLNDLIDRYAPNIKKAFEQFKELRAASTCPDGKIYSLPAVLLDALRGTPNPIQNIQRPFIHYSWLQTLGMKDPETLDDLYDVLKAFKEKDPNKNGKADEIPFSGAWATAYNERVVVLSALGFVSSGALSKTGFNIAMKDGAPVVAEAHPLYAEYLKYMNKLFTEGMIDKDIFTLTEVQANAKASQGAVGLILFGAPFVVDPQRWKEYEAFIPVTSQWNSKKVWGGRGVAYPGTFLITSQCKYPEAAIRLADLYFTEEYATMFWFGPKKDSPEALGHRGWYVKDPKEGLISYDWAEGIKNDWDHVNTLNPISGYQVGFNMDFRQYLAEKHGFPYKMSEEDRAWRESIDKRLAPHFAPLYPDAIYHDPKTQQRLRELAIPIAEYASTMEAKFITGAEPLTQANLDKYFAEMKKLGVEEYEKIARAGYEAYMKNLK